MTIRGSVDEVTITEVRGWAYGPAHKTPVLVQAMLNHEILGEARAGLHRPDLAEAGLGDGNSGFLITLSRPIDPLYIPFLTVKVDAGDAELPRAPVLGFAEFFSSLYAAHPAAGRPRSLLGGLWTDRTDAAALLRGKTGIGQIARNQVPAVSDLIGTGLAIIELEGSRLQQDWANAMPESIANLLQADALLAPLRAILEDNPLAVQSSWVPPAERDLSQPSLRNPSLSPAECLEIIAAIGPGVRLDVVRNSHLLPEFNQSGASRWTSRAALGSAAANALLDAYPLPANSLALLGPGTLYRVIAAQGGALRVLCLPERGRPAALLAGHPGAEIIRENGVRVCL